MPVKLTTKKPKNIIHVTEMTDGDIGEIVSWNDDESVIGEIVQWFGDHTLLVIGKDSGNSWSAANRIKKDSNCFIKILPKGTKLEIC